MHKRKYGIFFTACTMLCSKTVNIMQNLYKTASQWHHSWNPTKSNNWHRKSFRPIVQLQTQSEREKPHGLCQKNCSLCNI